MHRIPSRCLLLLAVCLALLTPTLTQARSVWGSIAEVREADLVVLGPEAGGYTVRLLGVAAPQGGAPFALQARLLVHSLVDIKSCQVWIETRNEQGEMVSRLLVDGTDVGLALVRAGLAKRIPGESYKPAVKGEPDPLTAAENEARAAQRGLWAASSSAAKDSAARQNDGGPEGVAAGVVGEVDINASKKSGADSECAIAQDPSNPLRLFQACNTASTGLFAARSVDGGATWTYPDATDKTIADGDSGQGESACCDPTLAWDSFGNLYVTYINSALNSIVTLLSTDGGATFSPLASFTGSIDQPTVVAANVPGGAAVWVVWNQSGAMVARGAVATGLGAVGAFNALQSIPGASGCSFGDVAIAPSGAVAQVCQSPTGGQGPGSLRFNVDPDGLGAMAFGASSVATTTNVGGFDFFPAQNGRSVDAEAGLAFDANPTSPSFGRLYLVYTEETVNENNDFEIMVRYSDDLGTTWSSPIRVNDDATTKSQFLPKIATDSATGNVGVCWHDCRNSGSNTAMELFCSTATPSAGAPVFGANVQLSDGASVSNGSGVEFGDYMGLAFQGGVVHPVWGDTSNSTGDNPNGTSSFDAYTDRLATAVSLFADGFETGDTSNWSLTVP